MWVPHIILTRVLLDRAVVIGAEEPRPSGICRREACRARICCREAWRVCVGIRCQGRRAAWRRDSRAARRLGAPPAVEEEGPRTA
jgi:hypothetical protein